MELIRQKGIKLLLLGFVAPNMIAFFHAHTFTHFTERNISKTKDSKLLSTGEKLKALLLGVDNPRPVNKRLPVRPYETVRIQSNNLLVFWGGLENGFWAYAHNPIKYAKSVKCPVLLLYGRKDETVSEEDTNIIFSNFRSEFKELKVYPNAAHENFLQQYKEEWTLDVTNFIEKQELPPMDQ